MKTFRFSDFSVYVKSKLVYSKIIRVTENIKEYSLKDQARRACLSIILNITEGSAKKSDREFSRFIQVSLGSVNELYACLEVMQDNNLIDEDKFKELRTDCEDIAKQLGGLFKKLRVNC